MPSGGARKGAGRKPKPLSEKIAAGNPGRRPLKKVEFAGNGGEFSGNSYQPPEYLRLMEKRELRPGIPTPTEIFTETVRHLEPSECLNLVPVGLIADYAVAKHHLLQAQYELARTGNVASVDTGKTKGGKELKDVKRSDYVEVMVKLQKNALDVWEKIWDIVARNSEKIIANPEKDFMAVIVGSRARKKPRKGDAPDGFYAGTENTDSEA